MSGPRREALVFVGGAPLVVDGDGDGEVVDAVGVSGGSREHGSVVVGAAAAAS